MAAFSDVGALCAFCGKQVFLPFVCNACSKTYCEEHVRPAAHGCLAATSSTNVVVCPPAEPSQGSTRRCPAKGCREILYEHNTVNCWRCRQDVCIRHRFEDDHPCVSIDVVIGQVLGKAREDMGYEGYAEAHSTLIKVFGNILKDPNNEKFRTLKKENAIVKQKLNHPACVQALLRCGFQDAGDIYFCRTGQDLAIMRQMQAALQKKPPQPNAGGTQMVNGVIVRSVPAPAPVAAASTANSNPGVSRLVNGVIVRDAPAPVPVASASSAAQPPAGMAPVAKTSAGYGPPKPKSAFDFNSRGKREQAEKSARDALDEARKLQKERYKNGGTDTAASQAKAKPPAPAAPKSAPQNTEQQGNDDCSVQ